MTVQENISLRPYNTFGIDVHTRYWAEYASVDELKQLLVRFADTPKFFIGQGSNVLFTKDYEGVVLHSAMARARAAKETADEVYIEAQSGLRMDALIEQLCDMNLYGTENLSHIPGEVGAAVVQNVGAYGIEAKDVISEVQALEIATCTQHTFSNADCRIGYRDSIFKHELAGKYVILSVTFRLSKKTVYHLDYGNLREMLPTQPSASEIRQAVITIRQKKLPEVGQIGSAGSFFKNPIVTEEVYQTLIKQNPSMPFYKQANGIKIPAAWLIEQAACKGMTQGGAMVYANQPLVIINHSNATPDDVMSLAQSIQKRVSDKFGIELQREVIYV